LTNEEANALHVLFDNKAKISKITEFIFELKWKKIKAEIHLKWKRIKS
jgi:hypothetical protein